VVLFGSDFWSGLMEWMKTKLLEEGTVSAEDVDLMVITEDVDEVVQIMKRQREKKLKHIEEAHQHWLNNPMSKNVEDVIKNLVRNNK